MHPNKRRRLARIIDKLDAKQRGKVIPLPVKANVKLGNLLMEGVVIFAFAVLIVGVIYAVLKPPK
jgi:hypothetical protein